MSLSLRREPDPADESTSDGALRVVPAAPVPPRRWRRPWVGPLAVLVVAFLAISLPRYTALDRTRSRVTLRDDFPLHYAAVIGHILFGSITLLTLCLQVWPWLRERHPAVHRRSGRVYVFAGALPTGVLALVLTPFSHGPAGNAVGAVLLLAATGAGYRAARQRRYADHRRWMVYSFALALSVVWGRVMFVTLSLIPAYDMGDPHSETLAYDTAAWIGVLINLVLATWWLQRTGRPIGADRPAAPA